MPPNCQPDLSRRRPAWRPAGLLCILTLAVFWPATRGDFINVDDQAYVTANPQVQAGLTLANLKWAFTHPVSANWHPLTMLSHMLDCQMFGLNPWGHHLTSVVLHALNAALVFIWLQQMTGARWRSLAVAALFAVHPLRVESVAWIAERKDVLSAFFGLLTLIGYTRYVKPVTSGQWPVASEPSAGSSLVTHHPSLFYALSLLCFALGLMSKPMLVTLPFVLLLLDYWPLNRIAPASSSLSAGGEGRGEVGTNSPFALRPSRFATRHSSLVTTQRLLLEKIPFFAVAAVAGVLTLRFQGQSGVVKTVADYPPGARIGNLLISYGRYLGKIFWPADLAVYYPHPGYWPLAQVLLAGGCLCAISIFIWVKAGRHPFLLLGWLWFLVTLLPVIGLVQVGRQAMADRYSYLPSLGVLILTVWGAGAVARRWRYHAAILAVLGAAAVVGCVVTTRQQLAYWQNSETLFRHTLAVTENNWFAHEALGTFLLSQGQTDGAIRELSAALRLEPADAEAHNNLGLARLNQGQADAAAREFEQAIHFKPDNVEAHYNLGNVFLGQGQLADAIRQFQEVLRLQPENAAARNNLGIALASAGRRDAALEQFEAALRLQPDDAEVRTNLARALEWQNAPAGR